MVTIALLNQVAAQLAGRPVMVRVQEPVWDYASAAAYKSLSGDAIIDINPGASDLVYEICHECAHVLKHWSQMAPTDIWRQSPNSQSASNVERAALRALPREDEADRTARIWLDYSQRYAWRYYNASNLFEGQLLALADYPRMEIENE